MGMDSNPPVGLTIAGSDSGGGAGVQADLKAMSRLGVHGCTVITALTAQNTREVRDVEPVSPEFLNSQLEAVMNDVSVNAVKTGMLFGPEIIETVVEWVDEFERLVVDPVMVAESGDTLLKRKAEEVLVRELLPEADLITPNWPETLRIADCLGVSTELDVNKIGWRIQAEVPGSAVLIKGGHREAEDAVDHLFVPGASQVEEISSPRLRTKNTHGSGCAFSSFITAYLSRGLDLTEAIHMAKKVQSTALAEGYTYGVGPGTLNLLCGPGTTGE